VASPPLVLIQTVTARAHLLPRLTDAVAPLDYLVITDDGGGKADPWRGYLLCLQAAAASDTDHVVVIQDDAIACFDFACHLRCAIEEEPESALVLFLAAQPRLTAHAAMAARRGQEMFVRLHPQERFMPAVAVAYPREITEQILAWSERATGRKSRSDDHMLGRWARETNARVLVTVPSLVQHPDDVPSVIGNGNGSHGRNPARVALLWDG
jgi:hypothetical protein